LVCFFATLSIILTASYSIWLFNRISFGTFNFRLFGISDLNKFEFFIAFSFFLLILIFGFFPNLFLFSRDLYPFFFNFMYN
jgi:NADH-ubiquinone oxidoreductase chain 4